MTRSILCRLGFHDLIELPKPKNRIVRTFFVRKQEVCVRCRAVYATRFNNGPACGGTAFCGYMARLTEIGTAPPDPNVEEYRK